MLDLRSLRCFLDVPFALLGHIVLRKSGQELEGQELWVNGRHLRVVKLLAQGGFSLVYLVCDTNCPGDGKERVQLYALKQVLVGSHSQLLAAQREIATQQAIGRLQHPNLMPLLEASIDQPRAGRGQGPAWSPDTLHAHLLYPYCEVGTLWDVVQQRGPLPVLQALDVFIQICAALQAMHSMQPALAHRDVKPLNVCMMQRCCSGEGDAAGGGLWQGVPHRAVLMDFGSTHLARVQILDSVEASAVREDAEAYCTPLYRAPELWAPSGSIDERVDVWSAGCLLFFALVGHNPFEWALGKGGGDLQAAVTGARVRWPPEQEVGCPRTVQDLVTFCLNAEPACRPFIDQVKLQAESLAVHLAGGSRWVVPEGHRPFPTTMHAKAWPESQHAAAARRPKGCHAALQSRRNLWLTLEGDCSWRVPNGGHKANLWGQTYVKVAPSRRCNEEWKERAEKLEQELEALRPSHPLAQLVGADQQLDELATSDLGGLALWQQAAVTLPPQHVGFLNAAQRYLLSKELVEQPAANPLPRVLARTPAQAALELAGDVLEAHAGREAGLRLGAEHGHALEQCTACLAALAADPEGQLLSQDDGLCLSHFGTYLLEQACKPSPPALPAAGTAGVPAGVPPPPPQQASQSTQRQPASQQQAGLGGLGAANAPINLSLSTAAVAGQLLARLCCCTGVGLLVLHAATRAAAQYVRRLVEVVTGQSLPGALGGGGGDGGVASQEGEEEGANDVGLGEEGLVHTVSELLGLLQALLQQLAGWEAEVGSCDALMSELTSSVMAAQEYCKLIAVTHGGVARQMQRVVAQLVSALHQVAASHDG